MTLTSAFTGIPLSKSIPFTSLSLLTTNPRRRPRVELVKTRRILPSACTPNDTNPPPSSENNKRTEKAVDVEVSFEKSPESKSPFVDEDDTQRGSFWERFKEQTTLTPLTEEEKQILREKLPGSVASFLIRRADDVAELRDAPSEKSEFLRKAFKDIPPDVIDWEAEWEAGGEYSDYLYETVTGPPQFRRKGTRLFGGGDGLPDELPDAPKNEEDGDEDEDDLERPTRKLMSLFVGNVGGIDEQAASLGYIFAGLFGVWILFKIVAAIVSFFVSFTFSFFAIFALSAGIFMVFFFLRF